MLSYCEGNGMPGGYQQTLPAEPQQHFHGAAAYPGSQSYEGWPGMALKQIMGQIDLLNFQNSYYNNSAKWPAGIMNNSHGYFAGQTACHDAGSGAVQQPKQSFKANCGQMESDNSSAWLGPQVWSRRIGSIDMSNDGSNQDSEPEPMQENSAPIKTEAPLPELDFLSWFSMDKKASIEAPSGNASPINPDDDFSAADLALASVPGLSFDPKSRCFTPEELKPQPIIRKRRKLESYKEALYRSVSVVYVCDAEKNEEYWAKRVKNNVAARRSREARRIKENQIALRAAFLERENTSLRNQVEALNGQNLEIKRDVEQLRLKLQTLSTDTDDNNKCSTPES